MYIINGASSGIGLATAKLLAADGAKVFAIGRNLSALEQLKTYQENIEIFQINDVRDKSEVGRFIARLDEHELPKTLGYMHSAGVFLKDNSWSHDDIDAWADQIQINLTGTYIWNKSITQFLLGKNKSGSIVNVVSQAWKTGGFSEISSYSASKGAIVSMTKNFARINAPKNIRFNCLAPGFVDNKMMTDGLDQDQILNFKNIVPMKRLGEEIEVAKAARFLLGGDSTYVTGTVLDVTGGLLLGTN